MCQEPEPENDEENNYRKPDKKKKKKKDRVVEDVDAEEGNL